MYHPRRVRSLLLTEVACIDVEELRAAREAEPGEAATGSEEETASARRELERARGKALWMVILCWAALAILFLLRERARVFLSFEDLDTVFTVGVLMVAVYSGYRLGQWERYRAVERALDEMPEES